MTKPKKRPEPVSPLPWAWNLDRHGLTYIRSHIGDYLYREEPYEGGHFLGEDVLDYIIWAANNAPKLEARIERLEAELLEAELAVIRVAMGGYPDSDLTSLAITLKARDVRCEQLEAALLEIASIDDVDDVQHAPSMARKALDQ